jgi:branched-chain amino acid transport system permease protein
LHLPLSIWLQAIINGLALGWLYVLMALGLTLIISIMGILQLAHGEIYMIGAYIVFFLARQWGVNLYLAMFISMLVMAGVGMAMERVLFRARPGRDPVLPAIVISTSLTLILSSFAVVSFGLYEKSIPRLVQGSFTILGAAVPKDRIVAIGFSAALLALLYGFLKWTRWGQAMVASAQNREVSFLRGINPNQMSRIAMGIGCGLAAAAGALAGSILALNPYMGGLPMVKGLVIIVLGGLGSLAGAAAGGMILGLIDGVVPVVFGSAPAAVAPLIIVILVLLVRPKGMFGHE